MTTKWKVTIEVVSDDFTDGGEESCTVSCCEQWREGMIAPHQCIAGTIRDAVDALSRVAPLPPFETRELLDAIALHETIENIG